MLPSSWVTPVIPVYPFAVRFLTLQHQESPPNSSKPPSYFNLLSPPGSVFDSLLAFLAPNASYL